MNPSLTVRPRIKLLARLLAVPALLLVGYAGMQLAPLAHATTVSASHSQLAGTCTSGIIHC